MRELSTSEVEQVSGGHFWVAAGLGAAIGGSVEAVNGGNALEIAAAAAFSGISAVMAGQAAALLAAKAVGQATVAFFGATATAAGASNVPAELRRRRETGSYVDPNPALSELLGT